MPRRKKGFFGSLFSLIIFIIICGLIFAFLQKFDYDVFAALQWLGQKFLDAVYRVADIFSGMDEFQKIVR